MQERTQGLRAYLPILIAAAIAVALAPATARAALIADGAPSQQIGPAVSFLATVTVGFDSGGGSFVDTQTLESGSLASTPVPDPTKTGHTFAGWYSDAGLTTPWDFSVDLVVADTTLYAKWAVNSYQVAFDSSGGTAVATQTLDFGSLASTPVPDPTKTGHTFAGWYSDPGLTTPWDFSVDLVVADTTLYAKWAVNSYQVAFDSSGGTAVATQTLDFGSLASTPVPDPTKTGHTFAGWYSDPGLTTPWDFSVDLVVADTTLYAKWAVNSYQVAFDSSGGTAVATQTLDFGSLAATPVPDPTKTGHTFAGWYSDLGLTNPWDFSADTVNADTMLFAKWTTTYTITGSAGAHGSLSISGPTIVPGGSSLTVTITPAAGYGVASLKVDGVSKGTARSYTFRNVTANHTISATFKRVTSTTLTASAKSIRRSRYVTLYATLKSSTSTFSNKYVQFEVKLPGSSRYILLRKIKVSSTGKAHYRYKVLNKGTRYHRVRFFETKYFLPAPIKHGLALRVR